MNTEELKKQLTPVVLHNIVNKAGCFITREGSSDVLAVLIPSPDVSALEFIPLAKSTQERTAVLCPDGEIIGGGEVEKKVVAEVEKRVEVEKKIEAIRGILMKRVKVCSEEAKKHLGLGDSTASYLEGLAEAYDMATDLFTFSIGELEAQLRDPEETED